jgi:spore germination protein KB
MFKETISPNQATKLLIVHIIGSATLFIMGLEAKMDIWIAILVAIAVSTLLYCVYAKILSIIPQSDFYMTLEKLLGRPITIVFVLILTWFVFDFGAAVLTNYNNFVFTVGLPETPRIIISLSMMLMCAIAVKAGTETLGRLSQLFIVIIVGFILLVTPLMIGNADFSNIKPVFHNGIKPIFKGALGVITFPFDNIMVFLLVFPAFKKKTKIKKIYLTALYIAGGLLLITSTLNVLVISPT